MDIKLPDAILKGMKSLEECIYERESVRNYKNKEIEIEKVSQILWASQGKKGHKRTVPSAGATFPLEIYVNLKNKGFYHYNFENHILKLIIDNDLSKKLSEASWNQVFISKAYLIIIICAIFERTTQRYGQRGVRYVFMEVGHCAQNIHLEAVSLGLCSVPIGAYEDNKVKEVLNLKKKLTLSILYQ
ncbi:MAG: SagB/ThcOx family dehydrogenase [Promethearchaeota archaeon]